MDAVVYPDLALRKEHKGRKPMFHPPPVYGNNECFGLENVELDTTLRSEHGT
jgi:hypothetical protein